MRLRISPPSAAKSAACQSGSPAGGGGPGRAETAWAVRTPAASVSTSTPSTRGGGAALATRSSDSAPALAARGWAAALSSQPPVLGKKKASRTVPGASASPVSVRRPCWPRNPASAANGNGRGSAASAARNSDRAGTESRARASTGRVSSNRASSGMQMRSQTSHVASPAMRAVSPGSSPAGGVTVSSSTASPLKPKLTSGPNGMRLGAGKAMGDAVHPAGSSSASSVAAPASPGFAQ